MVTQTNNKRLYWIILNVEWWIVNMYIKLVTCVAKHFILQFVISCFLFLFLLCCATIIVWVYWLQEHFASNLVCRLFRCCFFSFVSYLIPHSAHQIRSKKNERTYTQHRMQPKNITKMKRIFAFAYFRWWWEMEKTKCMFKRMDGKETVVLSAVLWWWIKKWWRNSTYQYTMLNRINATMLVNL